MRIDFPEYMRLVENGETLRLTLRSYDPETGTVEAEIIEGSVSGTPPAYPRSGVTFEYPATATVDFVTVATPPLDDWDDDEAGGAR